MNRERERGRERGRERQGEREGRAVTVVYVCLLDLIRPGSRVIEVR